MLVAYLKDQQLLKVDYVTPYGYRIDFVLHFDKHRKPVQPPRDIDTVNDGLDKYVTFCGCVFSSRAHDCISVDFRQSRYSAAETGRILSER